MGGGGGGGCLMHGLHCDINGRYASCTCSYHVLFQCAQNSKSFFKQFNPDVC